MAPAAARRWQVWIDTGGTFTDCLGVDHDGRVHRLKILSSSALRARIAKRLGDRSLELAEDWLPAALRQRPAPALLGGCSFRLLGAGGDPVVTEVAGFDPRSSRLRLRGDPGEAARPGAVCELISPEEAPVVAARLLTGTPQDRPLPALDLRLATTRGTNALLERKGAATAFFVTRGFGDLLAIGDQSRPDLFALAIEKPEPLHAAVVEVPERLAADGSVVEALDLEAGGPAAALGRRAGELLAAGISSAAVALLHAYRNPEHERALGRFLRRRGFAHVALSSELAPLIKILPRAETAVVEAYLAPVVGDYLERVGRALPLAEGSAPGAAPGPTGAAFHVMTSAGGLVGAARYRAKDSLLSGPAGGVVGAAAAGRRSGLPRVIGFDMGGTSTDVARHDGAHEYVFEHRVGDARLLAPALAIETVAAGGGSICRFAGGRLSVGPESAGADPGPACYGAGGPLTLTDVDLLLGRLDPERFGVPVDRGAAEARLVELVRAVETARGEGGGGGEALLAGCLEIADERMADAVRRISLRRGYDPADYALVAFGGAGGQHACSLAEHLGIAAVLVPEDAGLLSAVGLGAAAVERFGERQVLAPLDESEERLGAWLAELAREAAAAVAAEGVPEDEVEIRRRIALLRLEGQETAVPVELPAAIGGAEAAAGALAAAFAAAYRELYGYPPPRRRIEVESLRVVAASRAPAPPVRPGVEETRDAEPAGARRAWFGAWRKVPVYQREALAPGHRLDGPALVFERHAATVVAPGWEAELDAARALVLRRVLDAALPHRDRRRVASARRSMAAPDTSRPQTPAGQRPAAVVEELFTARFEAVAREMGELLRRTALSTNVKERLDFSCALLDPVGELVVNAPHIPVHLGALGLCVRSVAAALQLRPGDVALTNSPAFGGSHLPDVTVITPVFAEAEGGRRPPLLGYVASRAHHAEIGGIRPGSMPPGARCLAEEGVVIPPTLLVAAGEPRWDEVRELLTGAPWPTRAVDENLADLAAALAANHRGAEALRALAAAHGRDAVQEQMRILARRAGDRLAAALRRLGDGVYRAAERLDDGAPLAVAIEVADGRARISFAGSAPVHPGNLNATPAVVRSAVLYVLRLLVEADLRSPGDAPGGAGDGGALPLNEGLLRPVELEVPPGMLNPPFPDDPRRAPAVVGGNVETSQRLVDTLLKALRLAACSQGTMNNVLFGTVRFGYYETVCGGSGATAERDGAAAVHSHMTNTRATDPEVLERRYPVRLERFAVRRGSGGAGRRRGGDGAVRELTFLEPAQLSVLTQHRRERPYGVAGGQPGAPGRQRVVRTAGEVVELAPVDGCELAAGDRLVLETPGGGGWGSPIEADGERR